MATWRTFKCPRVGVQYTFNHREAANNGFVSFPYRRLHIPTGEVFDDVLYCGDFNSLCLLMAEWNRQGRDIWKYWER